VIFVLKCDKIIKPAKCTSASLWT